MILNYLRSAARNFNKNRGFSILNVIGLSLGIASSLLIIQYVRYERSYDTFHSKSERIYRMQYNQYQNGRVNFECAAAVPASGPAMKENFSEVEEIARLMPTGGVITYNHPIQGQVSYREENNIQITEPSIFRIFDIDFITGNPETCIDGPGKVAISHRAAKKYFGDDDAMGKIITLDGNRDLEVTAVFKNLRDNSHIKFDFLGSNEVFDEFDEFDGFDWRNSWGWYDHNTYVLLKDGVDYSELQTKWDAFLQETRGEDWEKYNGKQEFILQPMLDIHLRSNLLQESLPEEQGDSDAVYFLTIIAFFILVIAWVNYINLSTAKSMERANEVGVRKVMGAFKNQLTTQFLIESTILNLLATIIGVLLVIGVWPFFTDLTGRNLEFTMISTPGFWFTAIILFLGGTLLSGFYPALVMSSFKPVVVLKGKVFSSSRGSFLRQGLVIFQFTVSIVLISGTIIVLQQLMFMKNKDLGINIHQTLVVKGPDAIDSTYQQKLESFHTETSRISGIKSMSAATNVPGREIIWTSGIHRISGNTDAGMTSYIIGIDEYYVPSFNLELLAGRNFSREFHDEDKVILNRSLSEVLEFATPEEAIGKMVRHQGDTLEIVGIIEDYHQMSLKNNKAPIVYRSISANTFFSFKIETDNYRNVLEDIESEWAVFFPENPFDYFFLDEFFNRQYDKDRQFSQVFTIFSLLAIFVACMGLFGLASFMTAQRTKEIGIRKAMGSTVGGIVTLLSGGFARLVLIANIFALPLAWWIMNSWLQDFPYHIDINLGVLFFSGLLVVLIALASVSFQTVKAALLNPADTLRYE